MKICSLAVFCSVAAFGADVWVASHRAEWKLAPENSLAALRIAIDSGVEIVETDVRETKDGEIVVLHDPFVDRVSTSRGMVADMMLSDVKACCLHDALGQWTSEKIPTLREYMREAKGKTKLYLDKAGQDGGRLVPKLLEIAREEGVLEETVFVLDWPLEKAKRVFGGDLEKVFYCPVVEDKIPNLEAYVDEWLESGAAKAFQFRFASLDSRSYALLPKVRSSGARTFIAATWHNHTAGHDDRASLLDNTADGWGWLVEQGFTIIETNYPRELKDFLDSCSR